MNILSRSILALSLIGPAAQASELPVVGTGDGIEILRAVGQAYNARTKHAQVSVPPSIGSGGAVAAVGGEREKLGRVARPLTPSETGQGLVATPLVRIPSVIFVHPDAGVRSLSADQLAAIYAGRIENWSEVGGADLKIRVVRREDTDSTLSVLRASMPGWKDLPLTARSKTATTTQEAVETVKRVSGAIGFGPYSKDLTHGTVVLEIDGRKPHDDAYPSAVTLSLIHKASTLDDASRDFLTFATSPAARQVVIEGGGVPVPH